MNNSAYNLKTAILIGCAAAFGTAITAQAQNIQVVNIVTISLKAYVQNTQSDNGQVVTVNSPVIKSALTKDILGYLAQSELSVPSFGLGAQLALITSSPSTGYFAVVDKNLNVIQDVSDIMSFAGGNNLVASGKEDESGFPKPMLKGMEIVTITFDNTFFGTGTDISFSIQGLLTGTQTSTITKFSQTAILSNGCGEGTYNGIPLVLTATMTLKGSALY